MILLSTPCSINLNKLSTYKIMQEMNFAEGQIQSSDALTEMSLGLWEGCLRSEIHTPEVLSLIENLQPDFCAPSGESLREVQFRMVQFLNTTFLSLPEKLKSELALPHQIEGQGFSHDQDLHALQPPPWNMLHRHRQGITRKKYGKSRLQYVTTTGNHEGEEETSPTEANHQTTIYDLNVGSTSSAISSCVGVFTHSIPIKCLITGILGCSPVMSHKICVEDSSVTVLQHSWKTGWQIKRLNDTAHLRLL
uniref:Phosphoglycerate/bisphosphoglycerate mutase family protein n=1 Tax=Rhizophora mucronata TaxID=61149 RepID=A0A2P2LLA5_RHIMU